ncbi:sulfatase-like hydrolase/transferase [Ekhidna lutea]|nr:sulfatase-like hydrolase/transferase [Ekhidna lutea]
MVNNCYSQDAPPNVVILLIDDLGWGDFGFYGNPFNVTPNIDSICNHSLVYKKAYANSPVCSPSRAALITGKYPFNVGIRTAINDDHDKNMAKNQVDYLDPEIPNIYQIFASHGYTTGHFGKWHLGGTKDSPVLSEYGIDFYKSDQLHDPDYYIGKEIYGRNFRPTASSFLVDLSIDFLNNSSENPLLLNLWFSDVHAYLNPSQEQIDRLQLFDFYDQLTDKQKIYLAALHELDIQVGRLVKNIPDNTLLIITSDNGPETEAISKASHSAAGYVGNLRGKKRSLFEGGIRIPLIINWPEKISKGVNNFTEIAHIDLLPTLIDFVLSDSETDNGNFEFDGESMAESFFNQSFNREAPIYWEYGFPYHGNEINKSLPFAILNGKRKIFFDASYNEIQEYNLQSNPQENANIFDPKNCITLKLINESKEEFGSLLSQEGFFLENEWKRCNESVTSLDYEIEQNISIYPNPFEKEINVSFPENKLKEFELRISNAIGKIVFIENKAENMDNLKIDLSNLNQGLYFLEIRHQNGLKLIKLIKSNH